MRILFVCPSTFWSTQERLVLTDALVARTKGHQILIYGLRDSFLHHYAIKLGLEFVAHKGPYKKKSWSFSRLKVIKKYFAPGDLCVDLVHGYGFQVLMELAYHIRSFHHIPLLGTLTFDLERSFKNIWYRPMISRVDQFVLTSRDMIERVSSLLGVAPMKLQVCGIGLPSPANVEPRRYTKEFYTPDGAHLLGLHVGVDEENLSKILTVLNALRALNGSGKNGDFYLVLFCEKPWKEHVLFSALRGAAHELECADYTIFSEQEETAEGDLFAPIRGVQEQVDIWLGLPSAEPLEDLWISALLMKRPVVIPRTVSSMELLRQYEGCGETYKIGDAREIRGKVEKITKKRDEYLDHLSKYAESLGDLYDPDSYKEAILGLYERSLAKRRRLVRHHGKR